MPMTSMAIILPFFQPLRALAARVSGIRIRAIAAERRRRPNMSREYQRFFAIERGDWLAKGEAGRRPCFEALRLLRNSERARGRKAIGSTIAQSP